MRRLLVWMVLLLAGFVPVVRAAEAALPLPAGQETTLAIPLAAVDSPAVPPTVADVPVADTPIDASPAIPSATAVTADTLPAADNLAPAMTPATATPPAAPDTTARSTDPCDETSGERWWDGAHQRFSRALCVPSRWVDHFFIDNNNASEAQVGSTALRVTKALTVRDDHKNTAPFQIHASVDLPNLEQRFKLIFVNDDDAVEDDRSPSSEQSGEQTGRTPHGFRSAVRWGIRQSRRIDLDWDVGLRSGLHAWSQVRYRWRKGVSENGWVKFTQRVYFRDPEGFGNDSLSEYNYNLSPVSSLNFYVDGLLTERNKKDGIGWVISEGASWYYRLSEKSALQYSIGSYAWTSPGWSTQGYRTGIRYRRNIFRPWLFYDVEPFWEWPKKQDWGTVTGITLRLEMQFGYSRGTRL